LRERGEALPAALRRGILIGAFLGPMVIALGYELLRAWVRGEQAVLKQSTA
jgi:predicted PurR-regulated permease PerM